MREAALMASESGAAEDASAGPGEAAGALMASESGAAAGAHSTGEIASVCGTKEGFVAPPGVNEVSEGEALGLMASARCESIQPCTKGETWLRSRQNNKNEKTQSTWTAAANLDVHA